MLMNCQSSHNNHINRFGIFRAFGRLRCECEVRLSSSIDVRFSTVEFYTSVRRFINNIYIYIL